MTEQEIIEEWLYTYPDGKLFIEMLSAKLSPEQIVFVLYALDDTCDECYGPTPCYCWRDE